MSRTMIGKIGMIAKGEWNENTYYKKLDVVTLDGSSYVCIKDNENKNVLEQEYWHLIAKKGRDGTNGNNGAKGDKGDPFRYEDFTVEQLDGLKGEKGEQGIQGIQGLKGDTGEKGDKGAKGDKGDPFRYEDFTIEQLAGLKGEKGEQGIQGIQGLKGDTGERGDTGNGIESIEKTNTEGLIDIYTINYTDGTKNTFEITNGKDGEVTQEQFNEAIKDLQQQNKELSKNMTWNTVEGETIDIDDAHEYSKNNLKIEGNTKQETREGYNILATNKSIIQKINTKGTWNDNIYNLNGLTATFKFDENDLLLSVTINGTATANTDILIDENTRTYEAGTYTMYHDGVFVQDIGWFRGEPLMTKTFDEEWTTTINSIYTAENFNRNNEKFTPMLLKGSYTIDNLPTFETYRAMPSPGILSEIKCVSGDINIKKINNISNFKTESNRKNNWN